MTHDEFMSKFIKVCEPYLEKPDHPFHERACLVLNWITWIWEKPSELLTMPEDLAEVKFKAWHEMMDFHLWAELAELQGALDYLGDQGARYIKTIETVRDGLRQRLAEAGYQRLCPERGSLPAPSEVVPDPERWEPTDNPNLDGRVYLVEPGKAGYRRQGELIAPATAIIYRYEEVGE